MSGGASRLSGRFVYVLGAVVLAACAGAGTAAVASSLPVAALLAVLIVLVSAVVIVSAMVGDRIQGLELIVPACGFILALYGVRPLFDLASSRQRWVGTDVTPYYTTAIVGAVLFVSGFVLSYMLARKVRPIPTVAAPVSSRELRALRRGTWVMFVLGLSGLVGTIAIAGGLNAYISSRSNEGAVDSVAAVQYLISLGVAASAARVGLAATGGARSRSDLLIASLMALPTVVITAAEGSRRYVLPLVVGAAACTFVVRGRRLPVLSIVLLGCVAVLLLVPQEQTRQGGSEVGESYARAVVDAAGDPSNLVADLFDSQSTSMLSAFALGVGDSKSLDTVPGYGVALAAETVLQPIPQQLWPSKPDSIRNQLIGYRFGLTTSGCSSLCPTYGPMMPAYADFGLFGCLMVGVALGLFGALWTRITLARGDLSGRIAFSLTLWGFAYLWWSSVSALTLQILFYGVPILVVRFLVRNAESRRVRLVKSSTSSINGVFH